ncbi:MAG TPA: hypothetical protein PLE28_00840 [bacterium]|nr:hypothetical protein [bacterium]
MEKENNLSAGVNNEHHNHETLKEEAFKKQQAIMDKIYNLGFGEYIKEISNFDDAFDLEKHVPKKVSEIKKCVCCMDERTPYGIHAAGSGILLSDEEFEKYMLEENPDVISSHDGCGAGKIYCQLHGLPIEKSDDIAKEWAQKKAEKYKKEHIHLNFSDMIGNPNFHHARVCYIDTIGSFNYVREDNLLPAGFVVNEKGIGLKNALAENQVANDIVFGDHGLKEYFTPEKPFLIIVIAKIKKELDSLKMELISMIGDNPLIKIDGFVKEKE